MLKSRTLYLMVQCVLLVASPYIKAQSVQVQSSQVSVGSLHTDTVLQSDLSPAVVSLKESKKARSTAGITPAPPQLCFMLGVGWQSVPLTTIEPAERPSGSEPLGNARRQFAPKTKAAYRSHSGAAPASGTVCSGVIVNTMVQGLSMGDQGEPITPSDSIPVNATASDISLANSELNSANESPSQGLGTSQKPPAGASILGTRIDGLRNNVYASPFKLRREIWNAPDLQTRIRLERQLERREKKSARSAPYLRAHGSLKKYEKGRNLTKMHRSNRVEGDTSSR